MSISLKETPVLVHVGLPKCASTWLQRTVFGVAKYGFAAPWGGMTARAVTDFVAIDPLVFDADAVRAGYEAALGAPPPEGARLVVSHEALSSRPGSGQYYAPYVAERLRAVFPRARVLVVVREQKSIIYSIHNETVRNGRTRTIEEFIGTGREPDGWTSPCQLSFFEYDRLLRCYRERFGDENVLMLPMELLRSDHDAFCARLLDFAGLPQVPIARSAARNTGLGAFAMALTRRTNRLVRRDPTRRNVGTSFDYMRRTIRQIDRVVPTALDKRIEQGLRAKIAARVGDRYRESNARLSEMLGLDLAALGYR